MLWRHLDTLLSELSIGPSNSVICLTILTSRPVCCAAIAPTPQLPPLDTSLRRVLTSAPLDGALNYKTSLTRHHPTRPPPNSHRPQLGLTSSVFDSPTLTQRPASVYASCLPQIYLSLQRRLCTTLSLRTSRNTSPTNYRTSSSAQKSYTLQTFGTTQSSRTYLGVFLSRPSMARNTCWSQSSSAIYMSNHCAADQPTNSSPPIQPPIVGSKPMATIPSSRS